MKKRINILFFQRHMHGQEKQNHEALTGLFSRCRIKVLDLSTCPLVWNLHHLCCVNHIQKWILETFIVKFFFFNGERYKSICRVVLVQNASVFVQLHSFSAFVHSLRKQLFSDLSGLYLKAFWYFYGISDNHGGCSQHSIKLLAYTIWHIWNE